MESPIVPIRSVDPVALHVECDAEGIDERTVLRALRGERVRGRAGQRAARVIERMNASATTTG